MKELASRYFTGPEIVARYSITAMTLHRWLRDPELQFPQPRKIKNRRYFLRSEIEAFDQAMEGARA